MGRHSSASTATPGTTRRLRRRVMAAGAGVALVGAVGGIALADGGSAPSVYTSIAPAVVGQYSMVAGGNKDVVIGGIDGVPDSATSVQLSVTALNESATSSLYLYATGTPQPASANLRWNAGQVVTVPITTAVGGKEIHLHNTVGTAQIKISVIGYYSPANAASGAGYAVQVNDATPLSTESTVVATLTVPAGSYEVHAKIVAAFPPDGPTDSDDVECQIVDPSSNQMDDASAVVGIGNINQTLSLVGLDTTSGGAFALNCTSDEASDTSAYEADLVAVQLSSATGSVTGG